MGSACKQCTPYKKGGVMKINQRVTSITHNADASSLLNYIGWCVDLAGARKLISKTLVFRERVPGS